MNDKQAAALEALRKDLTIVNRTMAEVSAYMSRAFWRDTVVTQNTAPAITDPFAGHYIPKGGEEYSPTSLYYIYPSTDRCDALRTIARANGFVTVVELAKEVNFSGAYIYKLLAKQPSAPKRSFLGTTIFVNKALMTDLLSKTKSGRARKKLNRFFLAPQ